MAQVTTIGMVEGKWTPSGLTRADQGWNDSTLIPFPFQELTKWSPFL